MKRRLPAHRLGHVLVAVLVAEALLFDQPAVIAVALGVALAEAITPRHGPGALAARLLGVGPAPADGGPRVLAGAAALASAVALGLLAVGADAAGAVLAGAGILLALAAAFRSAPPSTAAGSSAS